jgi:uncharacterized membrane protein YfcA
LGGDSDGDALMQWLWNILAGLGAGALGAMGMGGGGILVIYLTLVLAVPQIAAQGVNLLFFLPCAVISLIINTKRKLVDWKTALKLTLGGLPAAGLGIWVTGMLEAKWLAWIFGGFLILVGGKELLTKAKS